MLFMCMKLYIMANVYSLENSKNQSPVFVFPKINVSICYKEILPVISHSGY